MESGQFGGPHFQGTKISLTQNDFISFIPKISIIWEIPIQSDNTMKANHFGKCCV